MSGIPSPSSLLQQAALTRVAVALVLIGGLWLAIGWAVALP
ncbi:hypothetical protein [Rhizobium sp. CSW-27]|nr:hypothetical protein [Rhizobium sp. CSW-27]